MSNTTTEDIFAELTATDVGDHFTNNPSMQQPFIGATLFPEESQSSSEVEWYKGDNSAVAPLSLSNFDTKAGLRDRTGLVKVKEETKLFKQGYLIREKMRQKLLNVNANGNENQKNAINNQIFNDTDNLIKAANISAELMRMEMLKTGKITTQNNGVKLDVDYGMKDTHIVTGDKLWSEDSSNPADDLQRGMDVINDDSGLTPTRVLMNSVTYRALQGNNSIKQTILNPAISSNAVNLSNQMLNSYLSSLGLTVQVYDKKYLGFDMQMHKYVDDGQVIIMPDGDLGKTIFSPSPAQADLLAGQAVDATMVDNVCITTEIKSDPVNKKFNASFQAVPTFEMIDGVYVLNGVATSDANRGKAKLNGSTDASSTGSSSSSKTTK